MTARTCIGIVLSLGLAARAEASEDGDEQASHVRALARGLEQHELHAPSAPLAGRNRGPLALGLAASTEMLALDATAREVKLETVATFDVASWLAIGTKASWSGAADPTELEPWSAGAALGMFELEVTLEEAPSLALKLAGTW